MFSPLTFAGRKKPQPFGQGFVFALPVLTVRASYRPAAANVRWTFAGRKKPRPFGQGFVFALPIFTASHPATIVGVHELNFCVRDGNRWTLTTINTNSLSEEVSPLPISSQVSRCSVINRFLYFFLVTHTGFEPMLTA